MQLALSTWLEVEAYLARSDGVILPTGSTEQHGPIGLIGTDTLCADDIAKQAATIAGGLVVPPLAYTPAPFNMAFPGTLSVSVDTFGQLAREVVEGLVHHGFRHIYVLNGHGANVAPMKQILAEQTVPCRLKSWWDFEAVNELRREWYGDWEGMHATPSEIAMTQANHRVVKGDCLPPPQKLTEAFMRDHAGDRHGPPLEHREQFPDGRVGSHSSLARPEHGKHLFNAAAQAIADDYLTFLQH
ncbi:MAG: creatininase family protein [Alphaproteobacteria bacterium]|nr:creatininase family protein [Alphaproteobacteria bacterium]